MSARGVGRRQTIALLPALGQFPFAENHSQRGRLASGMVEESGDGDGGTISKSVAMAFAGSPLPHVHQPSFFQMPSVVSADWHLGWEVRG